MIFEDAHAGSWHCMPKAKRLVVYGALFWPLKIKIKAWITYYIIIFDLWVINTGRVRLFHPWFYERKKLHNNINDKFNRMLLRVCGAASLINSSCRWHFCCRYAACADVFYTVYVHVPGSGSNRQAIGDAIVSLARYKSSAGAGAHQSLSGPRAITSKQVSGERTCLQQNHNRTR